MTLDVAIVILFIGLISLFNFFAYLDLINEKHKSERRMSMSYKVITSKDNLKIPVKKARVVVKEDFIEWLFCSEQEATDATVAFINAGFSSVRRE